MKVSDVDLSKLYRVKPGHKVKLRSADAGDTSGINRGSAEEAVAQYAKELDELQNLLYAENRHALLVILQGMDAGGKDGTIRRVMGPLNPQGCRVTSFKAPSQTELSHDFLWRIHNAAPCRGEIGIFNRSQYEDVLIVRVKNLVPRSVWSKRYAQINDFEKILAANNVHILKFFLHVSKDEQLKRLKERLQDPTKHWKANPQDFEERKLWPQYMRAYEEALSRCSTSYAPWHIVPADRKWFRNLVVMQSVVHKLRELHMKYPQPLVDPSTIQCE